MQKRPGRIYWFSQKDEKDILIFDAGYAYGDIHLYEHKKTLKATELEEQKRIYGYHQMWDLTWPGGGEKVTRAELEKVTNELSNLQYLLHRILAKMDVSESEI